MQKKGTATPSPTVKALWINTCQNNEEEVLVCSPTYSRPTPPPNSCFNAHTHAHRERERDRLTRWQENQVSQNPQQSQFQCLLTLPKYVILCTFLLLCVCVRPAGRRNFPRLQGVEGCLVSTQAPPSSLLLLLLLQPRVLLLYLPLLPCFCWDKTGTHSSSAATVWLEPSLLYQTNEVQPTFNWLTWFKCENIKKIYVIRHYAFKSSDD